jgi:hypothetical protein
MKQDLSRLEREISMKIQETKLKQQEEQKEEPELVEEQVAKEAVIIKMESKDEKQTTVQKVRRGSRMRL